MYLTDDDLLKNRYKYNIQDIEENVYRLNKKIMLATQTLTAEFCVKYILDLDIDNGSEDSYIYDVNYITSFQEHLTKDDMNQAMIEQQVTISSPPHTPPRIEDDHYHGRKNDPRIVALICDKHDDLKKEVMESPCRFVCKICKKKRVHGYTNPDHICNPFGYLFLAPCICIECSLDKRLCMWCKPVKKK